jgi:hypothetical protein
VAFLWKVVVALLAVATTLDAGAVVSDLVQLELLNRIATGGPFTVAEADANDLRQAVFGLSQTVAVIATGIPFILWLNRAYSNLATLGADGLRFRRWWTIGGWFIPIWSTFRPKQLVNDVWRGSDPSLPEWAHALWQGKPVPGWWLVWWLAYLFSNQAALLAFRISFGAETIGELKAMTVAYVAADAISVVAGVVAILVVRGASLRQIARATSLGVEEVRTI